MTNRVTRTTTALAATLALTFGLGACGNEETEEESAQPTGPAAEAAPEATEHTEESGPTEQPTQDDDTDREDAAEDVDAAEPVRDEAGESAFPTDPEQYAKSWVRSWGEGDMASVEMMTTPDALGDLDGAVGDENWQFIEGSVHEQYGEYLAIFEHSETAEVLQLASDIETVEDDGQQAVVAILFEDGVRDDEGAALPTDPGAYADALVQAWGDPASTDAELAQYAQSGGVEALSAIDRTSTTWARDGEPVEANPQGHLQVTYTSEDGRTLHLLLDDDTVAEGLPEGVIGVTPPQ